MTDPVRVFVFVLGKPSRSEDEKVPGYYEIRVASHLNESDRVDAALDALHSTLPIKALDDFQFDVVDDQLRPLVSVGTREGYELKHCAEFIGRVEEVPMLAVGTYALKEKRLAEYVKAQEDLQATSSDQVLARSDERRPQSDGVDLVHAAEALRDSADAAGCDDDLIVVDRAALVSLLEAAGVEHSIELSNGADETASFRP